MIITLLPSVRPLRTISIETNTSELIVSYLAEWTQEQKIQASDGTFGDCFGFTVSMDGDTALIGAFGDNSAVYYGSAYIFIRSGTTWTQQAKLVPTFGGYYDYFGYAVSLDGDTALIGGPGNPFDPLYPGAAYVFTRVGTTWTQQAKLVASDGQDGDFFGNTVALDGDSAIIGSEYWSGTGSAYVFTRTGTTWTQQTKITPADGFSGELFGLSLALKSNTALIGAPGDDDNGGVSGSVYVYTRSGATWTQQTKLLATDGTQLDYFGTSVSLHNDNALIGAEWDSDNGAKSGSAYVFTRTGTTWTQQAKLLASDGTPEDRFGHSVSLYDDTALIGADEDDDPVDYAGSAYVFTRSGTTWTQQEKLLASDDPFGRLFGESVCLDDDTALIGAYGDSDQGSAAGAAFIFIKQNYPPNPPTITGPAKGEPGTQYEYTFLATDPENNQLSYFIDWGDDTNSSWIGPYASGIEITKLHSWSKKGTYLLKAKAKDSSGNEGSWGTFSVTMPYAYEASFRIFWEKLFIRFPDAFPLLRILIGY